MYLKLVHSKIAGYNLFRETFKFHVLDRRTENICVTIFAPVYIFSLPDNGLDGYLTL